jgi:hypothetical protein
MITAVIERCAGIERESRVGLKLTIHLNFQWPHGPTKASERKRYAVKRGIADRRDAARQAKVVILLSIVAIIAALSLRRRTPCRRGLSPENRQSGGSSS